MIELESSLKAWFSLKIGHKLSQACQWRLEIPQDGPSVLDRPAQWLRFWRQWAQNSTLESLCFWSSLVARVAKVVAHHPRRIDYGNLIRNIKIQCHHYETFCSQSLFLVSSYLWSESRSSSVPITTWRVLMSSVITSLHVHPKVLDYSKMDIRKQSRKCNWEESN